MKTPLKTSLFATLSLSALVACNAPEPPKSAAQACAGLDPAKAAAPFYEPGNVYAARPLHRTVSRTRAFENRQLAGSELEMHATPGMTAEYLQRALSCHSVATTDLHPNDPLRPGGRIDAITVRSTGAGFSVAVMSNDVATAKTIWQRSQAFAGEDTSVEVRQISLAR
jgi:hypothetical protein